MYIYIYVFEHNIFMDVFLYLALLYDNGINRYNMYYENIDLYSYLVREKGTEMKLLRNRANKLR